MVVTRFCLLPVEDQVDDRLCICEHGVWRWCSRISMTSESIVGGGRWGSSVFDAVNVLRNPAVGVPLSCCRADVG